MNIKDRVKEYESLLKDDLKQLYSYDKDIFFIVDSNYNKNTKSIHSSILLFTDIIFIDQIYKFKDEYKVLSDDLQYITLNNKAIELHLVN